MQGRRQSIVMQGQPLIATISSTPEPSTPALTMKAAGSAAGTAAMMSAGIGGGGSGGVAPADVEVISEMPGGGGSGGGAAGSGKTAASKAGPSKVVTKGNESMGEELVARMDSVKVT
jgi:hypothetical protein